MKETLAGALLGLIVFLAFIGINVTPLILITLLLEAFISSIWGKEQSSSTRLVLI